MSQRRPRGSLGPADARAADDDFRRRHAKQNKEIILDNAGRKMMIKTLSDDIAVLQIELLEAKERNTRMKQQLERAERSAQRVKAESTRQALDHILSAVPKLRLLRDALGSLTVPTMPPTPPKPILRVSKMKQAVYPTATRPAEAGRQASAAAGLGAVAEGSEADSEDDVERDLVVERTRRPSPQLLSPASSVSSASPSPRKRHSRSRRRRESGLLLRPRSHNHDEAGAELASPTRAMSPAPEALAEEPAAGTRQAALTFPIGAQASRTRSPPKAAKRVVSGPNIRHIAARLGSPEIPDDAAGCLEGTAAANGVAIKPAVVPFTIPNGDGVSTTSAPSAPPIVASVPPLSPSEDDGRHRRARKSICYREPSLNKKMRKPDGLAVDDVLGTRRASAAAELGLGLPSLGANTSNADADADALFSPPAQAGRTLAQAGVRRKSTLYKHIKAEADDDDDGELPVQADEAATPRTVAAPPAARETSTTGVAQAIAPTRTAIAPAFKPAANSARSAALLAVRPAATQAPPAVGTPGIVPFTTAALSASLPAGPSVADATTVATRKQAAPRVSARPPLPSSIAAWDTFKAQPVRVAPAKPAKPAHLAPPDGAGKAAAARAVEAGKGAEGGKDGAAAKLAREVKEARTLTGLQVNGQDGTKMPLANGKGDVTVRRTGRRSMAV
ncbi:hypothetical protein Q5752_005688 [Cryptotrichosporon argae]